MLAPLLLLSVLTQQPALPGGAPLAPPARKVAPPRLAIEPAGRVNLGSVGPTEVREQRYLFTNRSDKPIALRVLDLSPGVTVEGPALHGPIAPKRSAPLTLRADPTDFVGWQPRNVKLGTDDPDQGEYFLPIGMTVRPDLTVDAPKKSLGEVALHETPQAVFVFRRETGQATKLWVSSPLPPYLEAEVESIPARPATGGPAVPPGAMGALRLTLRPALVDPGMLAGLETLTVESSAPHQPRFQLYLDWKLKLPVRLSSPRVVFLGRGEVARTLVLESRDGKPFRLESARLEGEGFTLEGPASGSARRMELKLVRKAAATAKALLVLAFDGEPVPLRVPVAFLPPPAGTEVAPKAGPKVLAPDK